MKTNQTKQNLKPAPSLCQSTMGASPVSHRNLRDRLFSPTQINQSTPDIKWKRLLCQILRAYHASRKAITRPFLAPFCAICATFCLSLNLFASEPQLNPEILANAIYLAEGGKNTKFPYGIKSIPCNGEAHCRRICLNTIRNQVKRHSQHNCGLTYLECLSNRYAPKSDHPLNKHWLGNVQAIYERLTQ